MKSHPIHFLGTANDLCMLHELRQHLQPHLTSEQPAFHLLNATSIKNDLSALLEHIQSRTDQESLTCVCLWGDHLLQLLQPLWKNHLHVRQTIAQNTRRLNQMAWVPHGQPAWLDWLAEAGFFDILSAGQHSDEWHWRLRRCAHEADKAANAALQHQPLPDTLGNTPLSLPEKRLLQALWQAAPGTLSVEQLCERLQMNPHTRSVYNLISKTNHKCEGKGYCIERVPKLGYRLTAQKHGKTIMNM